MPGFDLEALLTRDPEAPSELELDEWMAGLLPPARAAEVEAYVAQDAACQAYVAAARRGPAAVPGLNPDAAFDAIWTRAQAEAEPANAPAPGGLAAAFKRLFSPVGLGLLALGAAAAVAFFVMRDPTKALDPDADPFDPGIRMKGDFALELARKTATGAEPMTSGDVFSPGDEVRFLATLPAAGRIRVVGVEADGTLYTAWPLPQHGANPAMAAGKAQSLAGAVRLDGKEGTETMHLVLCPESVEPACTSAGATVPPTCPKGCRSTPFTVVKRRP